MRVAKSRYGSECFQMEDVKYVGQNTMLCTANRIENPQHSIVTDQNERKTKSKCDFNVSIVQIRIQAALNETKRKQTLNMIFLWNYEIVLWQ